MIENERKYLVTSDDWKSKVTNTLEIAQGYLLISERDDMEVRIRKIGADGDKCTMGIKYGKLPERHEHEIDITYERWLELACCTEDGYDVRYKTRHEGSDGGRSWVVDVYDELDFVLAEIELAPGETLPAALPTWVGIDVTTDPRYKGSEICNAIYRSYAEK